MNNYFQFDTRHVSIVQRSSSVVSSLTIAVCVKLKVVVHFLNILVCLLLSRPIVLILSSPMVMNEWLCDKSIRTTFPIYKVDCILSFHSGKELQISILNQLKKKTKTKTSS